MLLTYIINIPWVMHTLQCLQRTAVQTLILFFAVLKVSTHAHTLTHVHTHIIYTHTHNTCRFVKLKIILAPFKGFPPHPGHFEVDVTDSTTIHGLKMKIRTHLDDSADGIALFKEPSCSKASYLAPSLSLEECGIVGGPKLEPVNGEVFYDYMPVINDCPVLMTDSHIPDVPIFENGYTRNPYPNIKKHVMVPD